MDYKNITAITMATKIVRQLLATMNQEALSELVGCSRSSIAMIAIGERGSQPTHKIMKKLEALHKKANRAENKLMLSKSVRDKFDVSQGNVNE